MGGLPFVRNIDLLPSNRVFILIFAGGKPRKEFLFTRQILTQNGNRLTMSYKFWVPIQRFCDLKFN